MELQSDKRADQDNVQKAETIQIIVFKQGSEEYALHIDQIKEVVITPPVTRMPQTPGYIKGVANIRGTIIAILDLEEKFNLKQSPNQHQKHNYTLVVESEELKMGVLVHEVPNTLTVLASHFDDSVNLINDAYSDTNYIKGIIKMDKRLIILIDIFKIIDHENLKAFKKNIAA